MIPLNDLGLGRMEALSNGEDLDYRPYEVSPSMLGVIALTGLSKGDPLVIHTVSGDMHLEVAKVLPQGVSPSQSRYQLIAKDKLDIESVFAESGCFERIARLKNVEISDENNNFSQFRNKRYQDGPSIKLLAQTFGTTFRFPFKTKDLSRSGLLMISESNLEVPYLSRTLLELTIDPSCEFMPKSIACIAKVIRKSTLNLKRLEFGIHFVDMADDAQRYWRQVLALAEKRGLAALQTNSLS